MCAVQAFFESLAPRGWAQVVSKIGSQTRQRGMSLGVVAAMLAVVGALTLLGNALYSMRAERARIVSTTERMDLVVLGLTDFAILHKRVPCPANGNTRTGFEVRRDGGCDDQAHGIVPWRTLAIREIAAHDRWGHAFSYRVVDSLTTDLPLLGDDNKARQIGDALVICTDPSCTKRLHDPENGTGAAFVVIGHGEHAPGSFIAASGERVAGHPAGAEKVNLSARGPFVDRAPSSRGGGVDLPEHFDDVVRAMAISELRSEIAAGR